MTERHISVAPADDSSYRSLRRRIWIAYGLLVLVLAGCAWASDFFSPKGERTLYTARCLDGRWESGRCTGRLESAERIRYKVQKANQEVSYRVIGSSPSEGHLKHCSIRNGRNWTCEEDSRPRQSITLGLTNGKPDTAVPQHTEHCVSKWTWYRLRVAEKLS